MSDIDKELAFNIIFNEGEVKTSLQNVSEGVEDIKKNIASLEDSWDSWDEQINETDEALTDVFDTLGEGANENMFDELSEATTDLYDNFGKISKETKDLGKNSTKALGGIAKSATVGAVATTGLGTSAGFAGMAFKALGVAMMSNPIGWLLGAMSAAVALYSVFSDVLESNTEAEKESAEAILRMTESRYKEAEANKVVVDSTLSTLEAYKEIKNGTSDLKEGTEEYNDVLQDMTVLYKDDVDPATGQVVMSTEDLADEILYAKGEVDKYNISLRQLNGELVETSLRANNLNFNSVAEQFEELRISEMSWYKFGGAALREDLAAKKKVNLLHNAKSLEDAEKYRDELREILDASSADGDIGGEAMEQMNIHLNNLFNKTKDSIRITTVNSAKEAEDLFNSVAQKQKVASKGNLDEYADYLSRVKIEMQGALSKDVSPNLGFAPGLEEVKSNEAVIKSIDKKIKANDREIKQQDRNAKKYRKSVEDKSKLAEKLRRDALTDFKTELALQDAKLNNDEKYAEDYNKQLAKMRSGYDNYIVALENNGKRLNANEINFQGTLKDNLDKVHNMRLDGFMAEIDTYARKNALQDGYSEAERKFYADKLVEHKKFIVTTGKNGDREIEILNELILKNRELNSARLEATITKPMQEETAKAQDTNVRNVSTIITDTDDPKERSALLLIEEERYNEERLAMINKYAQLSSVAVVGEGDEGKEQREKLNNNLEIQALELEAKMAGNKRSAEDKDVKDTEDAWAKRAEIVQKYAGVIGDIASGMFELEDARVTKSVQKWLDSRLEMLDADYKRVSAHARTIRQQERIDEEFAQKEEDLRKEAEKKRYKELKGWFELEKIMNVASAISNTAVGFTQALKAAPPPFNFVLAGLVAAAGAVQIASINAQEMPEAGFYEGGYTGDVDKRKTVGVVHGKEFVVNANATRKNRQALERMNVDMPAYYDGGYVNDYSSSVRNVSNDNSVGNDLLTQNNKLLEQYLKNPVPTRAYLDDGEARKITRTGIVGIKRSVL